MPIECLYCGVVLNLNAEVSTGKKPTHSVFCPYCNGHLTTMDGDEDFVLKVTTSSERDR